MPTVTKYSGSETLYQTDTETSWSYLSRLRDYNESYAQTSLIASSAGTRSKPGRVRCQNMGFNIPVNARIDSVRANWREHIRNPSGGTTGVPTIPSKSAYLVGANGGSNSSSKTHNTSVPTSSTWRSLTWNLSEISNCKPANINSSNFGVHLDPARNTSGNTGYMYLDYIGATVEYTNPTYSLSGSITSEVVIGDEVTYTITLNNTNGIHQGYAIPVSISIPSGLTYKSQSGNGTYSTSTGKWNATLSGGSATLTLKFNSTSTGTKTVGASVDGWGVSLNRSTTVVAASYSILERTFPESVMQNDTFSFNVKVGTNSSTVSSVDVNVPIPEGFIYDSSTGDGSYNDTTGVWTASFTNKESTRTFTFQAITSGEYSHTVSVGSVTDNKTIIVISIEVTVPYSASHIFPDEIIAYMVDGETYTLSCYSKITDTFLEEIYPGQKNLKIAVIQGEEEILGTRPNALGEWQRIYVTFTYDSNEVPELVLYGQYIEMFPDTVEVEYAGFCIQKGEETDYSPVKSLFDDPSLLMYNSSFAEILLPANGESSPLRFNDINLAGRESDPYLLLKGIGISLDYITEGGVGFKATIYNNGKESSKSVSLDPSVETIELGGLNDLWGFNPFSLENIQLSVEFYEISGEERNLQLKNLQFVLYYQYDETFGSLGFTLNEVHSKNYNLFLKGDVDKPEGVSQDINTLSLNKRDGELITGISITSKKIKIPFYILGNTIEELEERLAEATKWLSNERNSLRIPIPKRLKFDWDKTREYEVVLNETIDVNYQNGILECEAEFIVPKGVGLSPIKKTGNSDRNNGLTKVMPLIKIRTVGDTTVQVYDNITGQSLTINHEFPENTELYIDCEDRYLYDSDGEDYTDKVTINSFWFIIDREYDFSDSLGCVVQEVSFREGL